MNRRKVCVVITARPSYSRIKTALLAMRENDSLLLQLVLAGSALLERYGDISGTLQKDGFTIDEKVFMVLEGENPMSMAKTTGLGILELTTTFYKLKPDMVLVIADRFETISVSIAAAYQNIPLVHIQGGEITGNIDEKVRHANTKFADIHLVASETARRRVISLGEDPACVFNTGCPSIDLAKTILDSPRLDFNPYEKYGGVGQLPDHLTNGYLVVMQHPVTTEYSDAKQQIEQTLHAVKDLGTPVFWFWPNVDSGADGISKGIRSFRELYELPQMHFFKNMEPEDFLRLIYNSKCLIGNSSVGIREASYLGVPVVNIGSRQHGRDRGENVIDCGYDKDEITNAIQYWTKHPRPGPSVVYGDGNAGVSIAAILSDVPLSYTKKIMF